jgi:signal transduction histidine kinase
MEKSAIVNFVKEVSLFKSLDSNEIDILSDFFSSRSYKEGSFIFKENSPRNAVFIICSGEIELIKRTPFGEEKRLSFFGPNDFLGEGSLMDNFPHSTSARAMTDAELLALPHPALKELFDEHSSMALKIYKQLAKVITRRMNQANVHLVNAGAQYISGRTRMEHDLLGDREVPAEAYYGVQTLRAIENFNISGVTINFYPLFITSLAMVKMAAARANNELGLLSNTITSAIEEACEEIIKGKYHGNFSGHRFLLMPLLEELGESLALPTHGRILWRIDADPMLEIDADRNQLYRILHNLVRNATQVLEALDNHAGPEIRVIAVQEDDHMLITVADNGPGVPPRAKENLFKAFQGSQRVGGTGLGLAIAAELTRAHGGTIWLEEAATGATFCIRMPSRPRKPANSPGHNAQNDAGILAFGRAKH